MRRMIKLGLVTTMLAASIAIEARAQGDVTHTRDVIYGRKYGLALTMDVIAPKNPNGFGVIWVVSGGWFSGPQNIRPAAFTDFLSHGYTVFPVVHGSQPKFTLPEIMQDMHRAVRFIRHNAKKYGIDPDHIGISGASAGGHLSLMMGNAGTKGNPEARDGVDRESSEVQAVACFFPPTDFLNWSKKGDDISDRKLRPPFTAAVDYHEQDKKTSLFMRITDKKKLEEIARQVSPITHVKKGSAPALIIHGDKDRLVPIYQAETIIEKYKEVGVPAKLVVREGADHGWKDIQKDFAQFADWFDVHLRKKEIKENRK